MLKENPSPKWGKAIKLFNGKDLTGWKPSGPSKVAWNVENGLLVSPGRGPELISIAKFNDFKLHVGRTQRRRLPARALRDRNGFNEPADNASAGVYDFAAAHRRMRQISCQRVTT